jgi:hypothetical protein
MADKKTKDSSSKPDPVKIDGDWEDAVGRALKKPRPKEGWPKPEKKKKKGKDAARTTT